MSRPRTGSAISIIFTGFGKVFDWSLILLHGSTIWPLIESEVSRKGRAIFRKCVWDLKRAGQSDNRLLASEPVGVMQELQGFRVYMLSLTRGNVLGQSGLEQHR